MKSHSWIRRLTDIAANGASDEEVAHLAVEYANSGIQFSVEGPTADVASTGGPSSLSTLLTPLFLVRSGMRVPKLGVPGRPAGGLDVLAQIPGYKINLELKEVCKVIDHCGYAHFVSSGQFVPLDADTFNLRQKIGVQAVPELVIASLLSKKLAVGIETIGIDVRVASCGNFGDDFETGRSNAQRLVRVANILGRKAICVLTDARLPFQPFIGRGEALWALRLALFEKTDLWLNAHVSQCKAMSSATTGSTDTNTRPPIEPFKDNIIAQGGSYDGFFSKVEEIEKKHKTFIVSPLDGYPHYDLAAIRSICLSVQAATDVDIEFPDQVGIRLLAKPDQRIKRGEPIMSVRLEQGDDKSFIDRISSAVSLLNEPTSIIGDQIVQ